MQQIFKYEIWWYCIHLNLANASTPKRNVQLLYTFVYTGNQRTTAHNLQSNAINCTKVTDSRSHSYTNS